MGNKTDCTNCPGCDYGTCRGAEPRAPTEPYDLERANFIAWYRDATVEEFAVACKNNADKLNALVKKYAREIELIEIFLPRRHQGDGKL